MKTNRQVLGTTGEEQALRFLQNKGFILVGKNLRLFCGEIDLLMRDGKSYVIVEVKTKSSPDFGGAVGMITPKKQQKLRQLARALWQKFPHKNIRIDVVAIEEKNINHIISAVEEL